MYTFEIFTKNRDFIIFPVRFAADGYIYWVDKDARLISRVKRDLTARENLFHNDVLGVEGMAVDWMAGNVQCYFKYLSYLSRMWTNSNADSILSWENKSTSRVRCVLSLWGKREKNLDIVKIVLSSSIAT